MPFLVMTGNWGISLKEAVHTNIVHYVNIERSPSGTCQCGAASVKQHLWDCMENLTMASPPNTAFASSNDMLIVFAVILHVESAKQWHA